MSSASIDTESHTSLAESFFGYLKTGINQPNNTYCQGNNNKFHDSTYIWCRVCDKVFCTQCSFDHLLNNQINHDKSAFLRKEHLDIQLQNNYEKVANLQNKMKDFLKNMNSEDSLNQIKQLKETLNKFRSLVDELLQKIIPTIINKCEESINKLSKIIQDEKAFSINPNNLRKRQQEIINKLGIIKQKFTQNEKLEPKMMKPYYENLETSYSETKMLEELIVNGINKSKDNNSFNTKKEYNTINASLSNAINIITSFKENLKAI